MNRLVVINHQPTVPPFMMSALKVAVNQFDEVVYINNEVPTNVKVVPEKERIRFVSIPMYRKILGYFFTIINLFSPKCLSLLTKGVKEKGVNSHFFKVFFAHLLYYWTTSRVIRSFLKKKSEVDKIYLLSVWFSSEAYCAAKIKQKHPEITVMSMAHSFEIFTSRDPYIQYYFNKEKLYYLDAVYFISQQGFDSFFSEVPHTKQYINKASVMYLGSHKNNERINEVEDGSFNICTCSRTIPLKRLDVLCEALTLWKDGPITWTHIGFGEDDEKIQLLAKQTEKNNPNVKIVFTGRMTNDEVKKYYSSHPVDLFVNLSTIEGLPISIMEVLSFGIPVVATDVGGTREIVNNEVGILLPSEISPEMVNNTISEYQQKTTEERKTYRANAFKRWEAYFSADKNFTILYEKMKYINR